MTPRKAKTPSTKEVGSYEYDDENRLNNPPAGLSRYVEEVDPPTVRSYDPHLDPQLVWSGKAERSSFEIKTVPLHNHEIIKPIQILKSAKKGGGRLAASDHSV